MNMHCTQSYQYTETFTDSITEILTISGQLTVLSVRIWRIILKEIVIKSTVQVI